MQMVVNSFDMVLGFGAAVPYTSLAQKAMSRHFRCLKDAIAAQLKHNCGLLGEKDVGTSGVTKGETPRLKLLDQSLRQQRAFHQMGMMEPEAWRPQRGLPERSTGLSRNQVSNWFINARVRLWKPMVEEMYQQESKEEVENHEHQDNDGDQEDKKNTKHHNHNDQHPPPPSATTQTPIHPPPFTTTTAKRSEINDSENDPSLFAINAQYCFSEIQAASLSYSYSPISNTTGGITTVAPQPFDGDTCRRSSMLGAEYRTNTGDDAADTGSTLVRFGTTSGDVSLTLGLRHAGNLPEKASFFS
ncbi:hypothetical protein L1987_51289 [Smallanthus sonchifolius]|uniref:Uncharacterized protein n=1 Tax=Smallanthus sonchifolius TaxID=185202 RepID=A0ACB9EQK7_9ASTR|nr:hypothetical protein L1987_51289 [Smallanthus sonchifolius]